MSVVFRAAGVGYSFRKRPLFSEISLELERGKTYALIGRNGSGKSTLLQILSGILPQQDGVVQLRGRSIEEYSPSERAREIAYLGSDLPVEFPLRAWDAVFLGRTSMGSPFSIRPDADSRASVESAMKRCLCWDWRDRNVNELSGGERQLVSLAQALVQGARILILDEALSKTDLDHQARMGSLLQGLSREQGYTAVLVSHDLNFAAAFSNECLILDQGKLVNAGEPSAALSEERLRALFPAAKIRLAF